MPTTTNIMQVCEAITQALRQRGFFDEGGSDQARQGGRVGGRRRRGGRARDEADAQREGPTAAARSPCWPTACPGMVTIVAQRRVGDGTPEDGHDSVNPDFGVTWALT